MAGWAFRDKTSGDLIPLETLTGLYDTQSNILTPDEAFLNRAQLQVSQETAGVNVLQFYPMWEPGTTSVRVVFWTEDLTGEDDVDVRNKDELTDLADLDVKTHYYPYAAGDEDAAYSNMGVETLTSVRTDTKLELDLNAEALVYTDGDGNQAVQPLTEWFAGLETMEIATSYQGEEALTDASHLYAGRHSDHSKDGTHRDAREGRHRRPQRHNGGERLLHPQHLPAGVYLFHYEEENRWWRFTRWDMRMGMSPRMRRPTHKGSWPPRQS